MQNDNYEYLGRCIDGLFQFERLCYKTERAFATSGGYHYCLALSPDGSHFAVAVCINHIYIYATADGRRIRDIGKDLVDKCGSVVYHPEGSTLLVSDVRRGEARVLEMTSTGTLVRVLGDGKLGGNIGGMACNGPLVAVSTRGVMLFDYESGALVRVIGKSVCYRGIRFTPDWNLVLVERFGENITQWSADGKLIKTVGEGALRGVSDVELADSGDWIACDNEAREIVVFSGEDGSELRRWDGRGCLDKHRRKDSFYPRALAKSSTGELWLMESSDWVSVLRC